MKLHYTAPNGNDFDLELTAEELASLLTTILPLLRAQAGERDAQLQRLLETLARAPQVS